MSSRFITDYLITELVQSAKLILPRKEPYIVPNFRVVMSLIISASKLYSVRLYLQLFAGECMSYLLYLCLFAYCGVQDILCCYFCFVLRLVSYVPNVTSFSGLSLLFSLRVFSNVYLISLYLLIRNSNIVISMARCTRYNII